MKDLGELAGLILLALVLLSQQAALARIERRQRNIEKWIKLLARPMIGVRGLEEDQQ